MGVLSISEVEVGVLSISSISILKWVSYLFLLKWVSYLFLDSDFLREHRQSGDMQSMRIAGLNLSGHSCQTGINTTT